MQCYKCGSSLTTNHLPSLTWAQTAEAAHLRIRNLTIFSPHDSVPLGSPLTSLHWIFIFYLWFVEEEEISFFYALFVFIFPEYQKLMPDQLWSTRRTVNSNRPILDCSGTQNCKINKETRKRCQWCRFEVKSSFAKVQSSHVSNNSRNANWWGWRRLGCWQRRTRPSLPWEGSRRRSPGSMLGTEDWPRYI